MRTNQSPAHPADADGTELDEFDELLAAAREIAERAYTPYSHYRVGAAGLTDDGRLVRGCNVETERLYCR